MPSGEESILGDSLTYRPVTRHHSGNYVCEADNGFGDPSTTVLKLDVQREWLKMAVTMLAAADVLVRRKL